MLTGSNEQASDPRQSRAVKIKKNTRPSAMSARRWQSALTGGPVGDFRLRPDLGRLCVLAAQPGWAWAPVDRWRQDGEPHPACQRGFARQMAVKAAAVAWSYGWPSKSNGSSARTGSGLRDVVAVSAALLLTDGDRSVTGFGLVK